MFLKILNKIILWYKSLTQNVIESNNNVAELYLLEYDEDMGRKKKQNKETETMSSEAEVSESVTTAPLNELALGIARLQDGTWGVAEIAYNAETGESDLQDVRVAGRSRDDAIELFKITAVEKGLV